MPNIKPISQSADKWMNRASGATGDYTTGVQTPRVSWQQASAAGEGNYKAGVTAAAAKGSYGKGVARAGDASWKKGATGKGPARYAEGVVLGKDDWVKGFNPFQTALQGLTLPPRQPKGSPQNIQRVSAVTTLLRSTREARG